MTSSSRSLGFIVAATAASGLWVASCTLDSEGTGELFGAAGSGGTQTDSSVGGLYDGGLGGTAGGGSGGTASGGTGGNATGGNGGTSGAGTGGISGTGGTAGSLVGGAAGSATGGTAGGGGSGAEDGGGAAGSLADAAPGETDCLNTKDDDGDGLVDCADPDCTPGYECVPEVPAGWEGYYRYNERAFTSPMQAGPNCPDGSVSSQYFKDEVAAIGCTCSCGVLEGLSCTPAPLGCAPGVTDCSSSVRDWTGATASGGCAKPDASGAWTMGCKLTGPEPPPTGTASCAASQARTGVDPFKTVVDLCTTKKTGGGCLTGEVCTPSADGTYTGSVCIAKAASSYCPSGWSATGAVAYGGYTDNRTCEDCQCTPPAAPSCAGTAYTFYDEDGCNSAANYIATTACQNVSDAMDVWTWSVKLTTRPTLHGQCQQAGGLSKGTLDLTAQMSVCCR